MRGSMGVGVRRPFEVDTFTPAEVMEPELRGPPRVKADFSL
jgi:hypothetical protein